MLLRFSHTDAQRASVQLLDPEHGNARVAYEKMGAPRYPTQRQLTELRAAAALPAPTTRPLDGGTLTVEIPSDGLMLITIPGQSAGASH